jgi:hypothetical protein
MKIISGLLGLVVAALVVALVLQHRETVSLKAALADVGKDREALHRDVRKLNETVTALQSRPLRAAAAAEPAKSGDPVAGAPAPAAPVVPTVPVERPGVTIKAPAGWHHNGAKADSYVVGVDSTQTFAGMPSAYVESLTPTVEKGFGGMMQTTAAESFEGKRVRLSGWVKTENANEGGGHLWMRVDGQERGQTLSFDNMDNRPVKGTSGDWQEASVVLDVPVGAKAVAYGFFVSGGGKMWVSGQKMEVVGADVPSTNMLKQGQAALPKAPQNLGFGR